MNPAELRDHCVSFPGAEETFPFGPNTSVFKVAGRCSPSLSSAPAEALRGANPAVLPGYHLNKRHWNTVANDGPLPDEAIRDMIEDSYDLVVSKLARARRRALGWTGDA